MWLPRAMRGTVVVVAAAMCLAGCSAGVVPQAAESTANGTASGAASSTGPSTTTAPVTSGGNGKPVNGLDPSALKIMNQPAYRMGQWAISVRDLDSGQQIISLHADTLFEPGSVTKTYSVGAAWQQFGPNRTLVTPVKETGKVVGGTLRGNLIVVGVGDLTLGGRTKPDGSVDCTNLDHNDANSLPGATLTPEDPLTGLDRLAAQVKSAGINKVSGNVLVDNRLWQPYELENGPVTPLEINQNLIDITTRPGRSGQIATAVIRPQVAPWTVTSKVKSVAPGQPTSITVAAPREGPIVVSGTIAANSAPAVNVYAYKDPGKYARTAFIEALARNGVTVTANPVAENSASQLPSRASVAALPTVASLKSLPLAEDAKYTLKVSYNRGAETFVCLLAVQAGSTDCNDGIAREGQIWRKAGLNTASAVLNDGSGAPDNFITPNNQVQLQSIMAQRPDAARWKAGLPILGVDGSLALVQPNGPAKGKVFAKTGSVAGSDLFNGRILLQAKALGGYIDTKSGRHFAFAIIAANSVYSDIEGVFAANDDVGKVVAIIQQSY